MADTRRTQILRILLSATNPATVADVSNMLSIWDRKQRQNVGSLMAKLVKQGELDRIKGWGPRKGYGYWHTQNVIFKKEFRAHLQEAIDKRNKPAVS